MTDDRFSYIPKSEVPGPGTYDPKLAPTGQNVFVPKSTRFNPNEPHEGDNSNRTPPPETATAPITAQHSSSHIRRPTTGSSTSLEVAIKLQLKEATLKIAGLEKEIQSYRKDVETANAKAGAMEARYKQLAGDRGDLSKERTVAEAQLKQSEATVAALKKELDKLSKRAASKTDLEASLASMKETVNKLEETKAQLMGQLEMMRRQRETLTAAMMQQEKLMSEATKKAAEAEGGKKTLEMELNKYQTALNEVTRQNRESATGLERLQKETEGRLQQEIKKVEAAEKGVKDREETIQRLQEQMRRNEEERMGLLSQQMAMQRSIDAATAKNAELETVRHELTQRLSQMEQQSTQLNGNMSQWQQRAAQLTAEVTAHSNMVTELHQKLLHVEQQKQDSVESLNTMSGELQSANSQCQQMSTELVKLKQQLSVGNQMGQTLQADRLKMTTTIQDLVTKISEMEHERDSMSAALRNCNEQITSLRQQSHEVLNAKVGLESTLQITQQQLVDSQKMVNLLQGDLNNTSKKNNSIDSEYKQLLANYSQAQSDLAQLQQTLKTTQQELERTKALLEKYSSSLDARNKEFQALSTQKSEMEQSFNAQMSDAQHTISQLNDMCGQLKGKAQTTENNFQQAKADLARVTANSCSLQDQLAQAQQHNIDVTQELMATKEKLETFAGRLEAVAEDKVAVESAVIQTRDMHAAAVEKIKRLEVELAAAQSQFTSASNSAQTVSQEKKTLEAVLANGKEQYGQLYSQYKKMEAYATSLTADKKALSDELGCKKQELEHLAEAERHLESQLASAQQQFDIQRQQMAQLAHERDTLQQALSKSVQETEMLSNHLEQATVELQDLKTQTDEQRSSDDVMICRLQSQVNEAQGMCKDKDGLIETLRAELTEAQQKLMLIPTLEDTKRPLEVAKIKLAEKTAEVQQVRKALQTREMELTKLSHDLEVKTTELSKRRDDLNVARQEANRSTAIARQLEQELATMKQSKADTDRMSKMTQSELKGAADKKIEALQHQIETMQRSINELTIRNRDLETLSLKLKANGGDDKVELLEKERERLMREKGDDLNKIADLERRLAAIAESNGRIKMLQEMTTENNQMRKQNALLRSQLAMTQSQVGCGVGTAGNIFEEQENDTNVSACAMYFGTSTMRPVKPAGISNSVVATPHRSKFNSSMMKTPPKSALKQSHLNH